ncbi:MAG TPA: DUF2127 domain-containing protein [Acidobacteriaceae bacterium]|jgi:uncharacterized membrane protein (DUF2068 family)
MKTSQSGLIRLIAVFKLLKASLLIIAGIGILKLMHSDLASVLNHWVATLGLDPDNRYIDSALRRAANIPPNRIKDVGLGSFVYAALFLTEGIGLWLLKRWAEWFTVVITASLVPLEIYEIYRHPTAVKVLVLLINLAIVAYLLYRIRNERQRDRQH